MANRTIAEQIAVLEARRTALEAALTAATTGTASFSVDGLSVSRSSPERISAELTRCEKSLQRLYRGGRGFVVDLSETSTDTTEDINETYTQRVVT